MPKVEFKTKKGQSEYNELIKKHPAYDIDNLKIDINYETLLFEPKNKYKNDKDVADLINKVNLIIKKHGLEYFE